MSLHKPSGQCIDVEILEEQGLRQCAEIGLEALDDLQDSKGIDSQLTECRGAIEIHRERGLRVDEQSLEVRFSPVLQSSIRLHYLFLDLP
ncbi:MAG: hypothetical protein JNM58_03610 [Xanthomonadaceae bacterium]|nr:hypothetical protein [Xanthomonadaceae bacterium]